MRETTKSSVPSDLNIFLFLTKLEYNAMKSSHETKKEIIAKLRYQEAQFLGLIAQWKKDINTLSTDANGSNSDDQGKISTDVQIGNEDQTRVQQAQQMISMTENIEFNSQQQEEQSMQTMLNNELQNFSSVATYNNIRG